MEIHLIIPIPAVSMLIIFGIIGVDIYLTNLIINDFQGKRVKRRLHSMDGRVMLICLKSRDVGASSKPLHFKNLMKFLKFDIPIFIEEFMM